MRFGGYLETIALYAYSSTTVRQNECAYLFGLCIGVSKLAIPALQELPCHFAVYLI